MSNEHTICTIQHQEIGKTILAQEVIQPATYRPYDTLCATHSRVARERSLFLSKKTNKILPSKLETFFLTSLFSFLFYNIFSLGGCWLLLTAVWYLVPVPQNKSLYYQIRTGTSTSQQPGNTVSNTVHCCNFGTRNFRNSTVCRAVEQIQRDLSAGFYCNVSVIIEQA